MNFSYAFEPIAATLWRDGLEAFFEMLAEAATRKLDAAGCLGPYSFECRTDLTLGNGQLVIFTAKEAF